MIRRLPLFTLAALAACSSPNDDQPITASVIGTAPRIVDPSQKPLPSASALLMSSTAQGLVRFDAAGQIEPGLAIRWDVSDDGLYYTFRIADTGKIEAEQVARWLRAAIGPTSRNPLKPVLGAIVDILAVTPEVIEIQLRSPRPDLLPLFAQPEMAILARGEGTGPLRIIDRTAGTMLLSPSDPPADAEPAVLARRQVKLRAEPASHAVARFVAGRGALVVGGQFGDLFVARAASLPANILHIDPTSGLFGFAVAARGGFTGVAENRRALSMSLDRSRIAAAFGAGWRSAATLVPAGLVDRPSPASPDWIDTPIDQRRILARETVATWLAAQAEPPVVRVALPPGPGSRLLFALIAADWASIGVTAVLAEPGGPADLKLIDAVAPSDSASWYLRQFECVRSLACSLEADRALGAAREAPTIAERAARLAEADTRLAEITAFMPIAAPLRWSLASRQLQAFQENKRAVHPLDQLRGE
jgi:oligopeptide transport system substrate-binding protein